MARRRPRDAAEAAARGRRRAALELVRLIERVAREGSTLMALATGGRRARRFIPHPEPPVYDPRTRSLLVYHHHGGEPAWPREAGHFHAVHVLRVRPRTERASLVAISMSRSGWPQALFTVNLWSWEDRPQRAHQLRRHVRRFQIRPAGRHARLARFANLVLRAWAPEIERLQTDKLRRLARLSRARPAADVPNDRSVDVLSALPIDARARAAGRPEPGRSR
jgi:hypothetical protein